MPSPATATAPSPTVPAPRAKDDVQPVAHETADRIATGLVTALPILALGLVGWQLWGAALNWSDVAVFATVYLPTGLGVTVGFHRLFTHRSFKTTRPVRACWPCSGSMAIEGPIISWVADHRKHHRYSDEEGDPHSPHVGHEGGLRGALPASGTRTGAGCSSTPSAVRGSRYAPDLSPIRSSGSSTAVRAVGARSGSPFPSGSASRSPGRSSAA